MEKFCPEHEALYRLRGDIVQREVDHLNWAGAVSALFTDDSVSTITVETDPTQCAFGKWYYGSGRNDAEQMVPALGPILANIEQPHTHLHEFDAQGGNGF